MLPVPHFELLPCGQYRLVSDYWVGTGICGWSVSAGNVDLTTDGRLTLRAGYTWNGPSGPAVDTPDTLGPSAAHDALYFLIAQNKLPRKRRRSADRCYRRLLRLAGVPWWRRALHFKGVRLFGWLYLKGTRREAR